MCAQKCEQRHSLYSTVNPTQLSYATRNLFPRIQIENLPTHLKGYMRHMGEVRIEIFLCG